MSAPPDSCTASAAALRKEVPIALGPPFWVSGRTRPTRTGPEPIVSPTVGPLSGCDCTGVVGTAVAASFEPKFTPPLGPQPASASAEQAAKAAPVRRAIRHRGSAGRRQGSETLVKKPLLSRRLSIGRADGAASAGSHTRAPRRRSALIAFKCGILSLDG